MDMDKCIFNCEVCGQKVELPDEPQETPECCGKEMKQMELDPCRLADTAEHSRLDESGEPCDDGRAGKI